jgi:calcineurin-like phosphoesterase
MQATTVSCGSASWHKDDLTKQQQLKQFIFTPCSWLQTVNNALAGAVLNSHKSIKLTIIQLQGSTSCKQTNNHNNMMTRADAELFYC